MTREDLIEAILAEAGIVHSMFIPKDEQERKKLANRTVAGHIGHGALRWAAGTPAGIVGGPANAARYAIKVDAAQKGKHRGQKAYRLRKKS